MKTLAALILGCLVFGQGIAQIQYAEYFIDDPLLHGQGHAISLPGGGGTDINISDMLEFGSLNPGTHHLYIRVRSTNGKWSTTYTRMFIVPGGSTTQPLDGFDYFFDSIPENTTATYLKFSTNTGSISLSDTLRFSALKPGTHHIFLRTRNTANIWSETSTRMFIVPGGSTTQTLDGFEYYTDSITTGNTPKYKAFKNKLSTINLSDTLQLDPMQNGIHKIFYRLRNSAGIWSTPYEGKFLTLNYGTPAKLEKLNYVIVDTLGNRSPFYYHALPSKTILIEANPLELAVSPGSMLPGKKYYIHLNAATETGKRGMTIIDSLRVEKATGMRKVSENATVGLFPNPVINEAHIMFKKPVVFPVQVKIFEATGKMMLIVSLQNENHQIIDLSGLPDGLFILKTQDKNGEIAMLRFIKYVH
jgi:hypothetical protein